MYCTPPLFLSRRIGSSPAGLHLAGGGRFLSADRSFKAQVSESGCFWLHRLCIEESREWTLLVELAAETRRRGKYSSRIGPSSSRSISKMSIWSACSFSRFSFLRSSKPRKTGWNVMELFDSMRHDSQQTGDLTSSSIALRTIECGLLEGREIGWG
jgi:hypothetical protein